jgi:thioredoxin-related protein
MRRLFFYILPLWIWIGIAPASWAYELVMVEREGCQYCIRWKNEIGPIYPKTAAGEFAPLRMIDLDETRKNPAPYKFPVVYTPTFILMENGVEISRIEGYASQDFFWGLWEITLERETDFKAPIK